MTQFQADKEVLKKLAKVKGGPPDYYTFIYVLLAHMHKKIHMETYNGLHGGWRTIWSKAVVPTDLPKTRSKDKWIRCYRENYRLYYAAAKITTLPEQAEWLRTHSSDLVPKDLAGRVLMGYDLTDAPVAQLAERSA